MRRISIDLPLRELEITLIVATLIILLAQLTWPNLPVLQFFLAAGALWAVKNQR